jgi:hypothetical protein
MGPCVAHSEAVASSGRRQCRKCPQISCRMLDSKVRPIPSEGLPFLGHTSPAKDQLKPGCRNQSIKKKAETEC